MTTHPRCGLRLRLPSYLTTRIAPASYGWLEYRSSACGRRLRGVQLAGISTWEGGEIDESMLYGRYRNCTDMQDTARPSNSPRDNTIPCKNAK